MGKILCKSCGSDRCGNHAACERRKDAERAKKQENDIHWACLMGIVYIEMRKNNRLSKEAEMAELDYIRRKEPLIFDVLQEVARRNARAMVADMLLLSVLADMINKVPVKKEL